MTSPLPSPVKVTTRRRVKRQLKRSPKKLCAGKPLPVLSEQNDQNQQDLPSRIFLCYQCHICRVYAADREAFLLHLSHENHSKELKVLCCSERCFFRTSRLDTLIDHLNRKDFHFCNSESLACVLKDGPMDSLTIGDADPTSPNAPPPRRSTVDPHTTYALRNNMRIQVRMVFCRLIRPHLSFFEILAFFCSFYNFSVSERSLSCTYVKDLYGHSLWSCRIIQRTNVIRIT